MPSTKNIEQVKEFLVPLKKQKPFISQNTMDLNVEQVTKLRSMFFKENIDFKSRKKYLNQNCI